MSQLQTPQNIIPVDASNPVNSSPSGHPFEEFSYINDEVTKFGVNE